MSLPARLLRLAPRAIAPRPFLPIRNYATAGRPNNARPPPAAGSAVPATRNGPTSGTPSAVDDAKNSPAALAQAELKEETDDLILSTEEIDGDDEFEEFMFDDITTIGHSNLDLHREARHYARLAAYEMPLLAALKTEFKEPTEKQILRFRYTTYMGEQHPAENKVVVEVHTEDLPLEEPERIKFMKLAGTRIDHRGVFKMSCERFEHQAQNKRYLVDKVNELIAEARNKEDMFEDIPLDRRHIRPDRRYPKPQFPESWKMTPERREQLNEYRINKEKELFAELAAIKEAQRAAMMQAQLEAQKAAAAPVGAQAPRK